MVVVGGRDSSNTIQLVRVCQPHCPTYHVETAAELRAEDFQACSRRRRRRRLDARDGHPGGDRLPGAAGWSI